MYIFGSGMNNKHVPSVYRNIEISTVPYGYWNPSFGIAARY